MGLIKLEIVGKIHGLISCQVLKNLACNLGYFRTDLADVFYRLTPVVAI